METDHILILNWNSSAPQLVKELMLGNSDMEGYARNHTIVVSCDPQAEYRMFRGPAWDPCRADTCCDQAGLRPSLFVTGDGGGRPAGDEHGLQGGAAKKWERRRPLRPRQSKYVVQPGDGLRLPCPGNHHPCRQGQGHFSV